MRQQACVEFRQSDENLDGASDAQGSCGVALSNIGDINYHGYLDGTASSIPGYFTSTLNAAGGYDGLSLMGFYDRSTENSFELDEEDEPVFYPEIMEDESSEGSMNMGLFNSLCGYGLQFSDCGSQDITMNYENVLISADLSDTDSIAVSPDGYVRAGGKGSYYEIGLVFNDGFYSGDWYKLGVSGKGINDVSLEPQEDGYVIRASKLKDVQVTAAGEGCSPERSFSTEYKEAFIYEIDENTIGIRVDTDGDGIFETELEDSHTPGDIDGSGCNPNMKDLVALQRYLNGWNVEIF